MAAQSPQPADSVSMGSMGAYDGPATVIADGTPYEVHAVLWCARVAPPPPVRSFGGLSQPVGEGGINWGGTVHAADGTDAWAIERANSLSLRTDDDREAAPFTVPNTGNPETGLLPIRGGGMVPFDCD